MMKFLLGSGLIIFMLTGLTPPAHADKSLGKVIRNSIRGEIRDEIRDSVRRDICQRREERGRNMDVCETLEDVDRVRDRFRRGANFIRTIDAILD